MSSKIRLRFLALGPELTQSQVSFILKPIKSKTSIVSFLKSRIIYYSEIPETRQNSGEKLIEELITEGEWIQETEHEEILVLKVEDGGRVANNRGQRTEGLEQVGNGLTLKKMRKHIKRLVSYAEACDGNKIREELKLIVPEYRPENGGRLTGDGG